MGESLVETPKLENKMGESVPCLQESVSFGRFEHDSLCWERWSTFPTNKYLEEVEKCSTPGSVAQKKAYFEAHYKEIAARKAKLIDQEKEKEYESVDSEDQSQDSEFSVCNTGEEELDSEKSKTQNLATMPEVENEEVGFMTEAADAVVDVDVDVPVCFAEIEFLDVKSEVASIKCDVSEHIDESNDDAVITDANEDLRPQGGGAGEDLSPKMESTKLEKPNLPVFVEEEGTSTLESQSMEELPLDQVEEREIDDGEAEDEVKLDLLKKMQEELAQDKVEEIEISKDQAGNVKELDNLERTQKESSQGKVEQREVAKKENLDLVKSENARKTRKALSKDKFLERVVATKGAKDRLKFENPKKMHKEVPVKMISSTINAKKKPASPIPQKSPMLSTPKPSKLVLSKSAMSSARPSVKKDNRSTPLTSKNGTKPLAKRVLPTSLHMSLSLGPSNSEPAALMMTRKSLIMEKMGDKDIVKRAFKAFQNFRHPSPSSLTKEPTTNQSATKKVEKCSALDTSQKKHEGITRAVKTSSPVPGQLGTKKAAVSTGLRKTMEVDQRNGKSASLGLRSQDHGYKQKEVSKNIEQKAKIKEAGKTHLQSKVKLEKPAPTKPPSCDVNFKAKLSSSYNQGQGYFKGLRKDDTKIQASDR